MAIEGIKRHRDIGSTIKECKSMLRKRNNSCCMDQISSLPDELLSHILSYLPTKEAVATSILSKRWRRAYSWMTSLEFEFLPELEFSEFTVFEKYVDSVMHVCQSGKLTRFSLKLNEEGIKDLSYYDLEKHQRYRSSFPELKYEHLDKWICFVLTRGVKEVDLCAHVRDFVKLPESLFCCETLEVLKLDVNLDIEIPMSFCLPNLKVLHLTALSIPESITTTQSNPISDGVPRKSDVRSLTDNDFISKLVGSCPSLEDLFLKGYCHSLMITISSPSLLKLVIKFHPGNNYWYQDEDDDYHDDQRSQIVLDTPKLQYFEYDDMLAKQYSCISLNTLVAAHIDISLPEGCETEDNFQSMLTLLTPLINITKLFLGRWTVEAIEKGHSKDKLPVFKNLKHLQLGYHGHNLWQNVLLDLLISSPFLERLTFTEGIFWDVDKKTAEAEVQYWSTMQAIPSCVMLHLKRIMIKDLMFADPTLEVVKYFLKNALVFREIGCKLP